MPAQCNSSAALKLLLEEHEDCLRCLDNNYTTRLFFLDHFPYSQSGSEGLPGPGGEVARSYISTRCLQALERDRAAAILAES